MRQQMPDQYKSQRISNFALSEPKARGRSSAAAAVPAGKIIHHPFPRSNPLEKPFSTTSQTIFQLPGHLFNSRQPTFNLPDTFLEPFFFLMLTTFWADRLKMTNK